VLKVRLSDAKKGTECSILSPNKQKMMTDGSLIPAACQIDSEAALPT
jgi:hypothetical protein